jgi:pimeloyl-ACP methyl ester carboxylesterase
MKRVEHENEPQTKSEATYPIGEEWLLNIESGEHINVRQDGKPSGVPIVLIHAFAGSLRQWDDVALRLATDHWVLRIDLLGHGASAKPYTGYSMPDQAKRVARVASMLGAEQFFAIGQSGGGNVVVALLENPEMGARVKGAMVIGTPPNMSFVNLPPLANIYAVPVLGRLMWRITSRKMVKDTMASLFAPDASNVPDIVVDDFQRMTRHSYVQAKAALEGFASAIALSDRVQNTTAPLQIVFGEQDQWIPSACTQVWQATTRAQIKLLVGVGHTPPLENPAKMVSTISDFVDDCLQ